MIFVFNEQPGIEGIFLVRYIEGVAPEFAGRQIRPGYM